MFKIFKNWIGSWRGYGACPNCGDNWEWKPHNTVFYDVGNGVTICRDCLKNPKLLNADRITSKLTAHSWKDSAVEKVRNAITNLKTTRGALQQRA